MTLRDALVTATGKLRAVPELREEAAEDATQLLLHVLGISRAALLANSQDELAPPSYTQYEALITRRLRHEPVQYITGEREFYGLPLRVTPAVLIPRNLTEHLVEAVLHELNPDELRPREQSGESLRIVDVGTGSGAIAIALACHLPHARIMALDNSPEALNIATRNLTLNNLQARIRLLHSDLLTAVEHEPPFDAIVSNPPYIPRTDRASLAPQVREFEPSAALFADDGGLEIYRRLIPQAYAALKPNGLLALEFGPGQHNAIVALLTAWTDIRLIEDFYRAPRIALARRVG